MPPGQGCMALGSGEVPGQACVGGQPVFGHGAVGEPQALHQHWGSTALKHSSSGWSRIQDAGYHFCHSSCTFGLKHLLWYPQKLQGPRLP